MNKNIKTVLALLLALCMLFTLAACGTKAEEPDAPAQSPADAPSEAPADSPSDAPSAEPAEESYPAYTIGYNSLGTGVRILDLFQNISEHYLIDVAGMDLNVLSANFSTDQMVTDLQNQVSAGEDGHLYYGIWGTQVPVASDLFKKNEIYWSAFYQILEGDSLSYVENDPYYCGSIGVDNAATVVDMAQTALDMGLSKCIILAGTIGDVATDIRVNTFTEVFEAGGGEILGVGRDDVEMAQKADDLMAAYGTEADCAYGLNMVFVEPLINAAKSYGVYENITFFSGDISDPTEIPLIKEGKVVGWSHGGLAGSYGGVLVINALDGHTLLDSEGKMPYYKAIPVFSITSETADTYEEYWMENKPVRDEDFQTLLYRNNPDITYEGLLEFIESITFNYVNK